MEDRTLYNKVQNKLADKDILNAELDLLKAQIKKKEREIELVNEELVSFGWVKLRWEHLEDLLKSYLKTPRAETNFKPRVRADLITDHPSYFNNAMIRPYNWYFKSSDDDKEILYVGNYYSDDWIKRDKPLYIKSEHYLVLMGKAWIDQYGKVTVYNK